MKTKVRGWTDAEMILSLVLLNLAGGDCISARIKKEALSLDEKHWHPIYQEG